MKQGRAACSTPAAAPWWTSPRSPRRSAAGHLGGAAVDVYPEEPETNSDGFVTELQGLPNVILTPHIGGSTEEAQEAIGREVAHLADQVRQHRRDHRRGELPAGRAAADRRARTASSTCTATCPACSATSTGSSRTSNANIHAPGARDRRRTSATWSWTSTRTCRAEVCEADRRAGRPDIKTRIVS